MSRTIFIMMLLVAFIGLATAVSGAPDTVGQPFVLSTKQLASDPRDYAEFGHSLALSRDGQIMVVGAPRQNVNDNEDQGKVYVFRRQADDTWTEAQTLTAPDGAANDKFGTAVAIANAPNYTIVVGAPNFDQGGNTDIGAAYAFLYNGLNWEAGVPLSISDANASFNNNRGTAVAISPDGSTIFVGAPGVSVGANTPGAVYVLTRTGPVFTYTQSQILVGPTGGQARMGRQLLVNDDNDLLFAAGYYAPSGPIITYGAVHVYNKIVTTWTYDERLTPSDGQEFDDFGHSMDISDDEGYLLIGAPQILQGEAYIFQPSGDAWLETTILRRPPEFGYAHFGASVSIDGAGETAVIGAWLNGGGGIHYFERSGNAWIRHQTLVTPENRDENLGYSVAMSKNADMVLGGARYAHIDEEFHPVGAVYTFLPGYQIFLPIVLKP